MWRFLYLINILPAFNCTLLSRLLDLSSKTSDTHSLSSPWPPYHPFLSLWVCVSLCLHVCIYLLMCMRWSTLLKGGFVCMFWRGLRNVSQPAASTTWLSFAPSHFLNPVTQSHLFTPAMGGWVINHPMFSHCMFCGDCHPTSCSHQFLSMSSLCVCVCVFVSRGVIGPRVKEIKCFLTKISFLSWALFLCLCHHRNKSNRLFPGSVSRPACASCVSVCVLVQKSFKVCFESLL